MRCNQVIENADADESLIRAKEKGGRRDDDFIRRWSWHRLKNFPSFLVDVAGSLKVVYFQVSASVNKNIRSWL